LYRLGNEYRLYDRLHRLDYRLLDLLNRQDLLNRLYLPYRG
jgi:hypothetical protein